MMIAGGLKSWLPFTGRYKMSSRPVDARYGYGVWLRHVQRLAAAGVSGPFASVAELGPGRSATIGACAIASGCRSYTGLDVLHHLRTEYIRTAFHEVGALFDQSAPIPEGGAYARVLPPMTSPKFPVSELKMFGMASSTGLDYSALESDFLSLENGGEGGRSVRWICPWNSESLNEGSVDLVISQAVLQEIPVNSSPDSLLGVLAATEKLLRSGGIASHQVDLGFYGEGPWNIHWTWSELEWKLVRGRRDNFVNREPLSTYVAFAKQVGFEIIEITPITARGVPQEKLALRYRGLEEADRTARAAHIILRKP